MTCLLIITENKLVPFSFHGVLLLANVFRVPGGSHASSAVYFHHSVTKKVPDQLLVNQLYMIPLLVKMFVKAKMFFTPWSCKYL